MISNLGVLGTFGEYRYVYYSPMTTLAIEAYTRMYEELILNGMTIINTAPKTEVCILLENNNRVIAGAFFNMTRYEKSIMIDLISVDAEFREKGIYTTLHRLIDVVGKEFGKNHIYSYIHTKNKRMLDHVMHSVGYKEVLKLVEREIK